MKFVKRLLSVLLIIAIASSLLVSCSNKDKLNKTAVGQVGGYDVYYEELRWMTMQYKDLLASTYGKDIWKNKDTAEQYRAELESMVYSNIIANYAILTLCDQDILKLNGVKFIDINSDEIQSLVEDYVNDTIKEAGSRSEYNKSLEKNYLTDSLYRFICGVDICENMLFKYYCELTIIDDSDDAAMDYIYENFIRTVHIYIQNDAKDNVENNRKLAEAVRLKLLAGEDINQLVSNYSEDRYMASEDGYYFTHGQYSKTYEDAAFALEMNGVSEVLETYSGFYVIKRLPLDDVYILSHFLSELKDQYLIAVFDKEINECKKNLVFVPNEFGKSLDLVEME